MNFPHNCLHNVRLNKDIYFSQLLDSVSLLLDNQTIAVWLIQLDEFRTQVKQLQSYLDEAECEQVIKLRFLPHKQNYVITHAILRILIGIYLKQTPTSFNFAYNRYGKPFLENVCLQFNLSHTNQFAVCAFAWSTDLGVDIEVWQRNRDCTGIIQRYFSEMEQSIYDNLPEHFKIAGFYQGWVSKEAFIKAIGTGLSGSLNQFSVQLDPRKQGELLQLPANKGNWQLHLLPAPTNHSHALVYKGKKHRYIEYHWLRN